MKNIITALNCPELNNKLKIEKNIKVINKDILYREGILEILEIHKEINCVIINYDLPGKISIEDLIEKIKKINEKIEIIFILEKVDLEKEKILKEKNIKNIYYNSQINTEKLIEIIQEKNKKTEQELEEEIRKLKKIIENKNNYNKNIKEKSKKICLEKHKKIKQKTKHNVEKIKNSVLVEERTENLKNSLALKLLEELKGKKDNILLVDLKLNHEDLHIPFHKEKIYEKMSHNNFLIHINKNVKLLTGLSKKIKNNTEKEYKNIIYLIEKISKKYNKIIIDILENNYPELNKKISEKTKKNILIFFNKMGDIKITKQKIEKFENQKNIYLFLEKNNYKREIDFEILKEIFKNIKIIRKKNEKINFKI